MIPCYGTYGSRQRIITGRKGVKKEKQVASSTIWALGVNVVLWLMECLTPTVSFRFIYG